METIKITPEELDALLERVESGILSSQDAAIIRSMANAIVVLSQAVNDKATSIKRLLAMVFGSKTEKKRTSSNKHQRTRHRHPSPIPLKKRK